MFEIKADIPDLSREVQLIEREAEDLSQSIFKRILRGIPDEMRREMLDSPPSGRQYRERAGEGFQRFHVASAKGNAPRNRTFALSNSFDSNVTGQLQGEVSMLYYAKFLDPFLGGSLDRPFIEKSAAKSIDRAIEQL